MLWDHFQTYGIFLKDQNRIKKIRIFCKWSEDIEFVFLCRPKGNKEPKKTNFPIRGKVMSLEVGNFLEQVCPLKDKFLSNMFIVKDQYGEKHQLST